MRPEEFQAMFDVSGAAMERLRAYHALLVKWQPAINLVGGKTLPDSWARHFADSAQISAHIPASAQVVADIGSGAGFPGMVLAILRPDICVHLIESDERKCQFLRTVSRETGVAVQVHAQRIERVLPDLSCDLITARALAPLADLCAFASLRDPAPSMLLLKGAAAGEEVAAARAAGYGFSCVAHESRTNADSSILFIDALKRCA